MQDSDSVQLETWLRGLTSRFDRLPAERVGEAIGAALQDIVQFLGVDRSTLIEFQSGLERFEALASWARDGVMPAVRSLDLRDLRWYRGELLSGRCVVMNDLPRGLPEDAVGERRYVAETGLRSVLTVPVYVGSESPVCALSIGSFRQSRVWPEQIVNRVRLAGEILGAALYRARTMERLERALAEAERMRALLEEDNRRLQEQIEHDGGFGDLVAVSTAMRMTLERVRLVAPTDASALLLGETGTGKELLARALHERSPRRNRALVKVNCAALPPGLIESELFGHVRGAFTGAIADRKGRFELAHGGTLFLDEIGDLELGLQSKLLRVLEDKEFEPVGGAKSVRVNVRILAATHRDLPALVRSGAFRADLFHRLAAFPIRVPPLRERPEDILPLAWHFLALCERELGKPIRELGPGVAEALRSYSWPGNVRELRNVMERAAILTHDGCVRLDAPLVPEPAAQPTSGGTLDAVQRAHIVDVLTTCRWRISGPGNAAAKLGMHPNTLRHRMAKLGIRRTADC